MSGRRPQNRLIRLVFRVDGHGAIPDHRVLSDMIDASLAHNKGLSALWWPCTEMSAIPLCHLAVEPQTGFLLYREASPTQLFTNFGQPSRRAHIDLNVPIKQETGARSDPSHHHPKVPRPRSCDYGLS